MPRPDRSFPFAGARPSRLTGACHAGSSLDGPNIVEFGDYVASLCAEFADIAGSARLPVLAYLLSLARNEAERVARDVTMPD